MNINKDTTIGEILEKEPLYQIISIVIFKNKTKQDYITTLILLIK